MKFNLVHEPWIPVVDPAVGPVEVSLDELFQRGPELADLAIPFAPERVAVTRLLVAVLQSATRGPSGLAERREWLEEPVPPIAAVRDYLQRWQHRFDLFDAERPFMQQPILETTAKVGSIAALRLDHASGNNVTLFDHSIDAAPVALSPGAAARALLTTLLYQPGGGVSKPFNRTDSPGAKPLMVLVQGETVWETIAANASRYDDHEPLDRPAWEREDDHLPTNEGTTPFGLLDRLTWRSRAVQLYPEPDRTVRTCRVHQHLKLADGSLDDPYVPIRRIDGEEDKIVRTPSNKRLWRASGAILAGLAVDQRQSVAQQAVRTMAELPRPRHPQLLVVGLRVDQAKVGDVQSAYLPVSRALLEDEDRVDLVHRVLEYAEEGSKALASALAARAKTLNQEFDAGAAARCQEPYWSQLGLRFPTVARDIAEAPVCPRFSEAPADAWVKAVHSFATDALRRFLASDPTLSQYEANVVAQQRLRTQLAKMGADQEVVA